MKIALCLSGQLRMVEACYSSIVAGLIDGYDVDTFIHAWFDPTEVGKLYSHGAWHDSAPGLTGGVVQADIDIRTDALYKPKKAIIEPQKDFTEDADRYLEVVKSHVVLPTWGKQNRFIFCPLSMFYSIWQANELKCQHEIEHGLYDVVVRCRFDMEVHEKVRYEDLDLSKISTSWTWMAEYGGVGDCLAIGNSANMDVYSDVYRHFDHLCRVTEDPVPNHPNGWFGWGTETLLGQHLGERGIGVNHSILNAGNVRG